jgi:hypothetical protein
MPCKSCGSVNRKKFTAEIGIHFSELKDIDKPVVWVFPESAWIVVSQNLQSRNPSCANSQGETPPRQVNLELTITSH